MINTRKKLLFQVKICEKLSTQVFIFESQIFQKNIIFLKIFRNFLQVGRLGRVDISTLSAGMSVAPYSNALSVSSFAVNIFCSVAVVYKLWKHKKNFAKADRKIQRQISIVLFCEVKFKQFRPGTQSAFFRPWFPYWRWWSLSCSYLILEEYYFGSRPCLFFCFAFSVSIITN